MAAVAILKLSACEDTIHGSLKGEVDFMSADTFKDEYARDPDGDPHDTVTLQVNMDALTERQARIPICPGMQAPVELQTGQKTVPQDLLLVRGRVPRALRRDGRWTGWARAAIRSHRSNGRSGPDE